MQIRTREQTSAIGELAGAIGDSFTHNRTERLLRLEAQLARLSRWASIAVVLALIYLAYQLWGELRSSLLDYQADAAQAMAVTATDAGDDARTSIFLIFATALGGPVILFVGYLVLGFLYNVSREALIRRIPLARFMVVPLLLLAGLLVLDGRRDEVKQWILEGHAMVARHLDSALALQKKAKAAGEKIRELRQMESQWRAQMGEDPADGEATAPQQYGQHAAESKTGAEELSQEEAVRRLGEMMLQLQGLSLQQPQQGSAAGSVEAPSDEADGQQPVTPATLLPTPAIPADI